VGHDRLLFRERYYYYMQIRRPNSDLIVTSVVNFPLWLA
jgi:hypothetical protein